MLNETERQLASLAVRNHILTEQQLVKAFRIQSLRTPRQTLEEILIAEEWLSAPEVRELQRLAAERQARQEQANADLFADRLIAHGYVTKQQVEDALRRKLTLSSRGVHRYLGDILMEQADVTIEHVLQVLEEQGKSIVGCAACGEQYNTFVGKMPTCPECGREMARLSKPRTVAVRATLLAPAEGAEEPGVRIGPCEITDVISRGPFGSLYQATHSHRKGSFAVKLFPLKDVNRMLVDSWFETVQKMAQVEHPALARTFESGTKGSTYFLVREYLEGDCLEEMIANHGRMVPPEALMFLRRITEGLRAIHDAGLIHGTLKGTNVIVNAERDAFLTDGGLRRDHPTVLNRNPEVLDGNLHFLAPEIWEGHPATAAADLYAAGVIFYFMITGEYPFMGSSPRELRRAHLRLRPPMLKDRMPHSPSAYETLSAKLLAKDPKERYRTAQELIQDLDSLLEDAMKPSSRPASKTHAPQYRPLSSHQFSCRRCEAPITFGEKACRECAATVCRDCGRKNAMVGELCNNCASRFIEKKETQD